MQECVSEFISFITSEASERCAAEKRKNLNGEDILFAMASLGLDNYVEPLKLYLQKYREAMRGERGGAGHVEYELVEEELTPQFRRYAPANPIEDGEVTEHQGSVPIHNVYQKLQKSEINQQKEEVRRFIEERREQIYASKSNTNTNTWTKVNTLEDGEVPRYAAKTYPAAKRVGEGEVLLTYSNGQQIKF